MTKLTLKNIIICVLFFPLGLAAQPDIPWKVSGKVKPRHARNINASNLWIGGETLDRDYADYDQYKAYLGPLGAKKLRLQSGWAKTEKTKGQYDFEWLDAIVNDALSQGVQPWIQTSYGNPIYEGAGTVDLGGGIPSGATGLKAWEDYVRALIRHFRDRVYEWEVWNEADLGANRKAPEVYAELFYRSAKIIREEQPEATIIALSMAHFDTNYITYFFDYLKDRNSLSYVDVVSFHGYPKIPESSFAQLEKTQRLIWTYKSDVKFWQGETGCPSTKGSAGALGDHDWTELTQAKWDLRRAMAHIGRDVPFSLFLLCEFSYLHHPGYVNRPKLNTKGLLKINEATQAVEHVKQAYYAYQNLCAMFDADAVADRDFKYSSAVSDKLSVFAFRNVQNKTNAVTIWYNDQIPSDINDYRMTTVTFDSFEIKNPVYVDIRTGIIYRIPKENIKRENNKTSVTVPVYDSPCVIANPRFF